MRLEIVLAFAIAVPACALGLADLIEPADGDGCAATRRFNVMLTSKGYVVEDAVVLPSGTRVERWGPHKPPKDLWVLSFPEGLSCLVPQDSKGHMRQGHMLLVRDLIM